MSEQRTSFSSRIVKRRDPSRAMLPAVILWLLAVGLGIFVPYSWATQAHIVAQLLNSAVLGASIFFFAQDKRKWKGVAAAAFVAVWALEALLYIRALCRYDIFATGAPALSLRAVLSESEVLLTLIRRLFYFPVFGFTLLASGLLRFSGRSRWWAIAVPTSIAMFACTVIYAAPGFITGGVTAELLLELGESLLHAAAIFCAAILCDWLCSFSAKALYLNGGAAFWVAACTVMCAATAGYAAVLFARTYDSLEYIVLAVVCAAALIVVLLGKREGMAMVVFGFIYTAIAAVLEILYGNHGMQVFIQLAIGAALPTLTWLILANSWHNTAPRVKKAKPKKPEPPANTTVPLDAIASAHGQVSTSVAVPETAGKPRQVPMVSVDMTQSIPIVTQLPPQASPKELKLLAKQQMAQQQALWKQRQKEAVLREKEAQRELKEQQAQQRKQEKQSQKDIIQQQKQQKENAKNEARQQREHEKLEKKQQEQAAREQAQNDKQQQKEKEQQQKKQKKTKTQEDAAPDALELQYPKGFCDQCGSPVEAGVKFCIQCGLRRQPEQPQDGAPEQQADATASNSGAYDAAEFSIDVDPMPPIQDAAAKARAKESATATLVDEILETTQRQESPKTRKTRKVYVQSDNCGTMHKNIGQATSYWVMRRPTMTNKPPFLLYTFKNEASARAALEALSFIHTAVDTGELICEYLMEYGYYALFMEGTESQYYEAVVCGHDLTPQRYMEAKAIFESNHGQLKSEQAPLEYMAMPDEKADVNAVVFKEEFIDNGKYRYRVFYAPNRASAIEFLRQNPVTEEFFYLMVDTPAGSYGRDVDGMYEV